MEKDFPKTDNYLNKLTLRKKMVLLFVFCVLIPLVVTDGLVIYNVYRIAKITEMKELESDAEAVRYGIQEGLEYPASVIRNIYKNYRVEELLNKKYKSALDYYNEYAVFKKNSLYESMLGNGNESISIYADNDTILNGGMFYKLSNIENEEWYKKLNDSNGIVLMFVFTKDRTETFSKRAILLVRKLDKHQNNSCQKVMKMEINYRNFQDRVLNDSIESDVYICQGDKLLMTNTGGTHLRETYTFLDKTIDYDYRRDMSLYGTTYTIYLKSRNYNFFALNKGWVAVILALFLVNLFLPIYMIRNLDKSVARRIHRLDRIFKKADSEKLMKINKNKIDGNDEITSLMINYNKMADRMNSLIQTVYVDKLRQQESDIAKQNAELQALHSQINPHFLFNALESIRMHSLIKDERETAEMVEHLAMMQRANVNWHSDKVSVGEEILFIEAYLKLQKYRFGDRLSYDIDVDESCADIPLPKLSIVTFVENACVHGIESKTEPGWIFVRVYPDGDKVVIEVEDTGSGIDEEIRDILLFKMRNASIDLLKTGRGIGMTNACLRLKMLTGDRVTFDLESEIGVGTTVIITMPREFEEQDNA